MLEKLTKAASKLESFAALIDEAHDTIERLTPSAAHQAVIEFVASCSEVLDMNADVIWGVILERLTPSAAHQAVIEFVASCSEVLDMNADVIWGVILDDMKKILNN